MSDPRKPVWPPFPPHQPGTSAPSPSGRPVPPSGQPVYPQPLTNPPAVPPSRPATRPPVPGSGPPPSQGQQAPPEQQPTLQTPVRADMDWDDTDRQTTAELEMSDGSAHEIHGVVLIGRDPVVGAGQTGLPLLDDQRSVSRTHLALVVNSTTVWAEDLGSANGSVVHLPDGSLRFCEPGKPVPVPVGSVIGLGEAWIRLCWVHTEPAHPADQQTQSRGGSGHKPKRR